MLSPENFDEGLTTTYSKTTNSAEGKRCDKSGRGQNMYYRGKKGHRISPMTGAT